MYTILNNLKNINTSEQYEINCNRIIELKKILGSRTKSQIENDYDLFVCMNEICFDKSRKFIKYEKNSLIVSAKKDLNNILSRLHISKLKSYCDIGCGSGHYPRAAFELGCTRCIGIDIEKNKFWEGYESETDNKISYMQCDIAKKIGDEHLRYDLVTSFNAFEHFSDPGKMLDAMELYVCDGGYLYVRFSPIYYSADGYHMYRYIQIPWYHLIFSENICNLYYRKNNLEETANWNNFNKWSSFDFIYLFMNVKSLKLVAWTPLYNFKYFWFYNEFKSIFPQLSIEDLMICGFEFIFINEK